MTTTAPGRLVAARYRLLTQIGGGGQGSVWLGRDELLGRQVAVKQIRLPAGTSPYLGDEQRQRALREGRIAARLSHPHAVTVYDVVLEDGIPYLVMEYLPSRSLSAVLTQEGTLRHDQVAQIGAQLADALAAVHAAGIVHRDVKPGNVLIGEGPRVEGLVKITDFGISHAAGDVTLTQTGQITGTPAFLAPEVAQGVEMTAASDVFSLGATLYTCLEGQPPFGMDDNALRLLHKVAGGEVRPPRRAGSLTRVLARMLATEPADRPDMTQVRDELAKLAAGRDGDTTTVLLARTDLRPGTPDGERSGGAAPLPPVSPPTPAGVPAPVPVAEPDPPTEAGAAQRGDTRTDLPAGEPAPAAGPPAEHPGPLVGARPRRRRPLLVALLALVVLAVGGGLLWAGLRDGGADPQAGAGTSSSAAPSGTDGAATGTPTPETPQPSAEETTAEPAPETTSASAPPAATTAPAAADPATEAQQTLEQYYALLPGDTAAAYDLTGPTLQSRASYGYYEDFFSRWSDINLLDVRDVVEQGDVITATTDVEFLAPGDRLVETHAVTFVRGDDGRLLIDLDVVA
ncbi:Serine/threonine protein kinase [Geodermatophilus telluris]|uniref:non-specific serine/threonine protein kinase n=1 Tax=Geodermatophilus telluris TaxID=1190417 RepID=A0A1G6LCM7_9ACTN|nr:serine/threonine-protein kinase [Geodermatophilus telluris]SDC40376.1 Serine/threonine protein kinase [Geodermatophilus telluris]